MLRNTGNRPKSQDCQSPIHDLETISPNHPVRPKRSALATWWHVGKSPSHPLVLRKTYIRRETAML